MNRKAYTLIELLSVVIILAIISVIAYPKIIDAISISKITAYNTSKKNIVESAKLKYLSSVNNSKIVQYTIDDLIGSGYLKKDIKNPLTNDEYKDTKVLITNDNNRISYDYIEGQLLSDYIINNKDNIGLFKDNDYIYKGINCNNYISFNGIIYRIIKIDNYMNIYIIGDIVQKQIEKENELEYINSYYNDSYSQIAKLKIDSIDALDYNDYTNTFDNDESFIQNNSDIYVKKNNKYSILSYLTNNVVDSNKANNRFVLKLKNSAVYKSGNGTQIDPYIID